RKVFNTNQYLNFRKNDFCYFSNFLSNNYCKNLYDQIIKFEERRVICKTGEVEFGEQEITKDQKIITDLFLSKNLITFLNTLLDKKDNPRHSVFWTSVYRKNEYINRHKNISGDIQVLLCLRNDGNENRGALCIEANKDG